ncbi:hypothetical protein BD769DRAFT_1671308 [Suillus cothurnatus]|nr:hypothetical protein BD769DRAFT_1671308 [Suillus cothurnatus]
MSPHRSSSAATCLMTPSELGNSESDLELASSLDTSSSSIQDPTGKVTVKRNNMVNNQQKGIITAREQCLHFARWIPHAIDMFCNLNDTFRIAMLMEEEEAYKVLSRSEDEDVKAQRDQVLSHVNLKQQAELHAILAEMQAIMGQVHSDDTSHLKNCIAQYAAPDPSDKGLEPPIYADNKSHMLLSVNHPQLAAMLCPIKHAKAYHEDPTKVQAELQNGVIKIHSAVFRHIFTSPSSALTVDGEMNPVRGCNAKLHSMEKVEPEHIAYVFIQSQFGIASHDKWQETDGYYKYSEAYTHFIKAIQEAPDQTWAESLLQRWNRVVFGNKMGLIMIDLTEEDQDNDLIVMQRQHKMRMAAAHQNTQLPENAAAIPTAAEDTATVPPTSTTQLSEVADSLALPLASPLPSATSHSVDPEMESAK